MEETEVKVKEKNCLNCGSLFTCPEILGYSCKKYVKAEPNKADISTRYMEILKRISGLITELAQIEVEMKIAEKAGIVSQKYCPKELTTEQFHDLLKDLKMSPEEFAKMPTEMKEKILKKHSLEPEKSAISKRNKSIIKLVEQGKGVKEIAGELKLEPGTVEKELQYLLKNGMVKTLPS
jgi:ATP/maltotriose-dependent transcriptional regulator MalT